jgi:hypothetical protein
MHKIVLHLCQVSVLALIVAFNSTGYGSPYPTIAHAPHFYPDRLDEIAW